ncbi:ABC transporter permease [Clostridium luticellarii]|jgi:NitT/TauT family transport system permease protein|uniref:Putative aliphatic sulfonates transport permease protein SsuC n=1 Tax=Clostridium luticellarii TaxID=1691940 RepID=A0A2T0BNI2_9CLOT|nr:ABC transporter permease [Clostridium luticellarii]MCI1945835.1 ABC transporter permease [Clostridium luticellarii]MCI1968979.1 ABC transporter permease [Clostridium luticellarii]MCI1996266.1 ABC transporter permease [Clostridium luticellarii]MCI2040330.1 ABC transporter permease [Clostridium luticellarii]PRR85439.1 putative aliphatic sulfonates transport permease protein SsuC [Clostridium luticellarii]
MSEVLNDSIDQVEELKGESFFTKVKDFVFNLRRLFGIIIFLLTWEISSRVGIIDKNFLPPFSVVMQTFFSMLASGELETNIAVSLKRSLAGFGLGLGIAIPLGLIIGSFNKIEFYIDPLLQLFRQTSTLALLPVFMLFFGIGETSKVAIVFWGVWSAILLNTINGVRSVEPILIKSAKSMGASQLTIFRKVILPSALPSIITGIRLSATSAILVLIAAEMMGASSGLGYLLYDTQIKYQIPKMYASIVTMSLIGIIVNYIIVAFESRVTKWR